MDESPPSASAAELADDAVPDLESLALEPEPEEATLDAEPLEEFAPDAELLDEESPDAESEVPEAEFVLEAASVAESVAAAFASAVSDETPSFVFASACEGTHSAHESTNAIQDRKIFEAVPLAMSCPYSMEDKQLSGRRLMHAHRRNNVIV